MNLQFILNDTTIHTDLPPGTTVLDFVRYHRHLMGTKIGCREGDCGACTVLVGKYTDDAVTYQSMTSCLLPLSNVQGKHVVTVEGINSAKTDTLTPVQEAMVAENGTQCGFCTVGFVMSLTGHCLQENTDNQENTIAAIDGNICRCTGYKSIERAAARLSRWGNPDDRPTTSALDFAIEQGIVPAYFSTIKARLLALYRRSPIGDTNDMDNRSGIGYTGGGTDLYVQRPEEMEVTAARPLFDDSHLKGIREVGNYIEIGGAATVTDLMESPVLQAIFPKLKTHLKLVSSTPIRNMATVAGNLVNASPIGDLTVWMLALNATVVLRNGQTRAIPLRDFYRGYKLLDKTADEVLEKIRFLKPVGQAYFNFEKVSKRTYLDIASVNSALTLQVENGIITEAHLAAGGVAPIPLYLSKTSAFLVGKMLPVNEITVEKMLAEANEVMQSEVSPISDVRGSADYKRLLLKQLFHAHLLEFIVHTL